jgi:hypothetical protein
MAAITGVADRDLAEDWVAMGQLCRDEAEVKIKPYS